MDRRVVYLDNNGTTRMADEVVAFMHENDDLYGNASSICWMHYRRDHHFHA